MTTSGINAGKTRARGCLMLVLLLSLQPLSAGTRAIQRLETKGAQLLVAPRTPRTPRLASDLEIPQFRELTLAWSALPKQTNWVETVHNRVPALIAVQQVGNPSNSTVLVAIHGLFGAADNWKHVAADLGQEYRLWLVDLPGCGMSDCPDPGRVGPGGYSPAAMAERLLQALQWCAAQEPRPQRLVLVGHSLGGMILLRMLADQNLHSRHAELLDVVEGLVLFAPADVIVTRPTDAWLTVLGLNGAKVCLGHALGVLPRAIEESLRTSYCDPRLASRELAEQGVHMLRDGGHRRALRAMIIDAIPWRVFMKHPDWPAVRALESTYTNVHVPCLIGWGDCDETLSIAMGHKIKDQLPDARMVIIPETMHMVPLERPLICARLIRQFDFQLRHGSRAAARSVETFNLDEAQEFVSK